LKNAHLPTPKNTPGTFYFFRKQGRVSKQDMTDTDLQTFSKTLDKRLNVKVERLNPGFLFYTMVTTKNWGGDTSGAC
jgi:hypothetical protein